MKKIFATIILTASVLQSCNSDTLSDMNTDPNSYYTTVPITLVTYAEKSLSDYMNTPNVNTNNLRLTMQYWQETTYLDESRYDFQTRKVTNSVWDYLYVRTLKNLDQAKKLINDYNPTASEISTWPTTKKNQLAIIDIMQVYTYQTLVDTHGNIPYSQSLDIDKFPLPVYDDASGVYAQLIARLQTDIANLDSTGSSFPEKYYNGNVGKWKKFANSLLLKLGIAIADSNPTLAQSTCQAAITGGVFTSAADDCALPYLSASPNYSQLYANLVASNRNDYVAGKTLVDQMNSTSDARRSAYFQLQGGVYVGGTIGTISPFTSYSAPGTFAYTTTTPGVLLNYTEVAFYLAEASARWPIGGVAATNYATAVTASFQQWGKTAADAATYLLANPYNAGNWKQSIGNEAWIAMYNQPMQGWNFWRRLDYPVLAPAVQASPDSNNMVPVRLQYPINEQTTNPTNYAAGSAAIGGDKLFTKIFWDKF